MRIRVGRRPAKAATVAALTLATLSLATGGAYAAGPGGVETCPSGTLCLYYNSPNYNWGSFEHWTPGSFADLTQYTFRDWANGSGYNAVVATDAASLVNNTSSTWYVCNGYFYTPSCWSFGPGYANALPSQLHNNSYSMYSN
jgi:hypothetical protein